MHPLRLKFSLYFIISRFWVHVPIWVIFFTSKGYNLAELALINSSMWLSVVIFEIPTGYIADIFGRKVSLIWSYIVQAMGVFLFVIGTSVLVLVASGVVWGIGITLASGAETAWIYDEISHTVDKETSDDEPGSTFNTWYSSFRAISSISSGIAQLTGGILASFAIWLPHCVIVGLFILTAILLVTIPEYRETDQEDEIEIIVPGDALSLIDEEPVAVPIIEEERNNTSAMQIVVREFQKPNVLALSLLGIIIFSFMDIRYFMQVDFEQSGVSLQEIGIFFAIISFVSSAGSYLSSRFYDYLGNYLFLVIFVVIGFLFNLMAFSSIYMVMLLFGLIDLSYSIFGPSYQTVINKDLESKFRATTLSMIGVITKLVYILFSIGFGVVVGIFSFSTGYIGTGLIFLIAGLTLGYLLVRTKED